jgi:hypothetical protein
MLVFVVAKKVREGLRISCWSAFREGIAIMQGLKPKFLLLLGGAAKAAP